MHAGNPGEAQVVPGPLRNHGAAASRAARVHERGLPGAGGRESRVPHSFFLLSRADSALHQLFLSVSPFGLLARDNERSNKRLAVVADRRAARDGEGHREGASRPAAALEGDARRPALQVAAQDARCQSHHGRRATLAPGPAAAAHNHRGVAAGREGWGAGGKQFRHCHKDGQGQSEGRPPAAATRQPASPVY